MDISLQVALEHEAYDYEKRSSEDVNRLAAVAVAEHADAVKHVAAVPAAVDEAVDHSRLHSMMDTYQLVVVDT